MTVSNTYSQHTNIKRNRGGKSAMRKLLLCAALFFSFSAIAQDNPPSFVNGVSQPVFGCDNVSGAATGTDLTGALAITDADTAQTETWNIFIAPLHGTLAGFPTTAAADGGVVTPGGLTYIPDTAYTGTDSFTVMVSDGTDVAYTTVTVTVIALPTLSSTLTPAAICDGTIFYYSPTSATGGATFSWHRAYAPGISNAAAGGVGNVLETLGNTTYYSVPATYTYIVMAHGCTGNPENVVVQVKPTPTLSSPLNDTACSGGAVNYVPASLTVGTTYTWSRGGIAGITPDTSVGSGTIINEALTNTTTAPVTTAYRVVLTANGCTAADFVNVVVNPQPASPVTSLATSPTLSICAGTSYLNFGAGIAPPAGITYSWSATNASIYNMGSNEQYILVNFPNAGDASVTFSYSEAGTQCVINDVFSVNVGAGPAPSAAVIYDNAQFVYEDNTVDSYQWGYDNTTTLDSTLLVAATFQSYVNPGPDYTDNYYWVITTKDGCAQKTYFNAPTAVTNINSGSMDMKVYPNPAGASVNVTLGGNLQNGATINVMNMLGQTIKTQTVTNHTTQLDVDSLPAGCYLVSCYQDGVKIATARFIKN